MKLSYEWKLPRLRAAWADELRGMSPPVREATFFRLRLERYKLHIYDGDLLAGWYGFETNEELCKAYRTAPPPSAPPAEKTDVDHLIDYGFKPSDYDRGHHELDYRALLARGVNGYIADVDAELARGDNDVDKTEYLRGMRISLCAAETFAGRFAALAERLATEKVDEGEKRRLLRIATACKNVPMRPAKDFFEAMQAVALLHAMSCITGCAWYSVSIGGFDRFMYPYYEKSRRDGMDDEEAIALICMFFRLLDLYGGKDSALSVGGVDENGNDATNELSYLVVEAEKRSKLSAPLFVARINKNTPTRLMRELVDRRLFEIGQPSFYSEENCLAAIEGRGIPREEARRYEISTCMNIVLPDSEACTSWGIILNTHLPLELALCGRPLRGELPIEFATAPAKEYGSVDEIFAVYKAYMREMFAICARREHEVAVKGAKETPDPWLSALTKDCIRRGRDRWDGGAVYNNIVIEMMGFANTADAITAIDELVFRRGKYTIDDFVAAARANYEGFGELLKDLAACPKYGMNDDRADANARRLLDVLAEICEENRTENRRYLPSLHTLWNDVEWGAARYAFLDGRRDGEPVNKNAGPVTAVRAAGPTAVALSACKLDQVRYSGGQALDVHIGVRNMDSNAVKDKIAAYIRTYFDLGGLQLQVNGLTADTLQKAYDEPEKYPDLMVRIGGHSRYFNTFSDEMKRQFIKRFKVEEGAFGL